MTGVRPERICLPSILTAFMAAPALDAHATDTTEISLGAEYRSGDYGSDGGDISDVYVPVTLAVHRDAFAFRLTVPYAAVEGPEGSLLASDAALPGEGPEVSNGGLGDIIAGFTLVDAYTNDDGSVAADLTGTVKLGTAEEDDALGTGETDYSAQVDLYRFFERSTTFASLGYKVRGEPPGFDVEDTWFAAAGAAWYVSRDLSLGGALTYRPEVVSDGDAASEASLHVGKYLGPRTEVRAYALIGLTDGSPDWGSGFTLSFRI